MRRNLLTIALALIAAIAGVFIGRELFDPKLHADAELHDVLHHRLELDTRQQVALANIEARFAVRRRALELELRAENARLADAIETEHGNGPRVREAVDRCHATMGEFQKETLAHIFAMRQILRPDQAAEFDRAVVGALTDDAR
ncbi:MAG: periplasmic heavy metal sensor [Sphingomonas sp.]|uniref:periplasmic heavy metal sensor n=1 Tax=Sphingomonas sp. TaxID=28214 RepID=UPI0018028CD9|nr:periplasmic heavy metal sensor [Sphingomonas sp.]MBA3666630.1 periplasmic heavy metal sensor [Sphingomonas sp.]